MKETKEVSATGSSLLCEGKSTRLLQMRQKAMGRIEPQSTMPETTQSDGEPIMDEDLLMARQLIDRRLQEVMAGFPPNKRERFFKIRYGMTPEQLKSLPIGKILNVLKFKQIHSAGMKRIADLDYNGRPTSNRADQ